MLRSRVQREAAFGFFDPPSWRILKRFRDGLLAMVNVLECFFEEIAERFRRVSKKGVFAGRQVLNPVPA